MDSMLRPKSPGRADRGRNRGIWSLHVRDEQAPLKDALAARAEEMGVTLSSLTFEAIREYLENHRGSS